MRGVKDDWECWNDGGGDGKSGRQGQMDGAASDARRYLK